MFHILVHEEVYLFNFVFEIKLTKEKQHLDSFFIMSYTNLNFLFQNGLLTICEQEAFLSIKNKLYIYIYTRIFYRNVSIVVQAFKSLIIKTPTQHKINHIHTLFDIMPTVLLLYVNCHSD